MSGTNTPAGNRGLLGPDVSSATLFQLTQERPDLWVQIIEHPNAYPALLDWFKNVNQPQVKEALARRLAQRAPTQAPLPTQAPAPRSAPLPTQAPAPRPAPLPTQAPAPRPAPTPISPFQPRPVDNGSKDGARSVPTLKHQDVPRQVDEAPDDHTVLAKRRAVYGDLLFGETIVPLTRKEVVLGRKVPSEDLGSAVQVVTIPDPTKTISGKHAKLTFEDGAWNIEDLGSTNGIYLVDDSGEETLAVGKIKLESSFYLGDVRFSVRGK